MPEYTHQPLLDWNSCPAQLNDLKTVPISSIKKLHVYDFDNTLYNSPQPTRELYSREVYQLVLHGLEGNNNGPYWWSEPSFLQQSFKDSLGTALYKYWNEKVIKLAKMSYAEPDTVSILMTGRRQDKFKELISDHLDLTRAIWNFSHSELEFNAVVLKRPIDGVDVSTIEYKKKCLVDFIKFYPNLEEVTVYDDRRNQLLKFKAFFNELPHKNNFQWFVIPVPPRTVRLVSEREYKFVMEMFDSYNAHKDPLKQLNVAWSARQTGYFLSVNAQRAVLQWSLNFLKSRNMESANKHLSRYPMFIPSMLLSSTMPQMEMVNVLTNNSKAILKKRGGWRKVIEDFYGQTGETVVRIKFTVTKIGIRLSSLDDRSPKLYYLAEPTNSDQYVWNYYSEFIIIGVDDAYYRDDVTASVLDNPKKGIRWYKPPTPLNIQTYFGTCAQLKIRR
ncbi:hypothetical protein NCAS_0C00550 [Naumovozyma castellii]|uniref:Uncharacterized protein n=1 Tax=Naumovozyma castellii TaxID=27288 RepID=G0VC38_NAUCA|nr:hypothetical protein NCAS_0C00550 [Naumovozyma castellii CBS 4309]CCC69045.1 hypothetical protein NCAS_0C00550 [Naumovozyma castellii CBS 4309]